MRLRFGLAGMLVGALCLAAPALADAPVIEGVSLHGGEAGQQAAEVDIRGAFDTPAYEVHARDGGRVLVVDVAGAQLADRGVETQGTLSLVTRTVSSATARGARIELALSRPATYRARADKGHIRITLEALPTGASGVAQGTATAAGGLTVQAVRAERRDGRERIVVELNGPAAFRVTDGPSTADGTTQRLEIRGASLAPGLTRQVASADESVLREVRVSSDGDRAVVSVLPVDGAEGTAVRIGSRIVWMFNPGEHASGGPSARTIAKTQYSQAETAAVAAFLSDTPLQASGARSYAGKRIDLDFKDADIHNILRLISDVGNVNVVTSDDVKGRVTIKMRDVPWDEALDVVLKAKGLGMVRHGNLIRVAPRAELQKEREEALAAVKARQKLAPLETRIIPVSYAKAANLAGRVQELITDRGSVSVDERTNVLIVRDISRVLDESEALVRTLDTQTPQVLVEARIVEATSQYSRDVGIQWGGNVSFSSLTGNPTGVSFPSNIHVAGGATDNQTNTGGLSPFSQTVENPNFAVNLPAVVSQGQGGALGLTLGSVNGAFNLGVRLSAAEASGNVRIISSPRVLTLDNHEATIQQGTLIPYSRVSAQGVNTAFQEAKLELTVTPHVTSDGSVAMDLKVTRDEPDFTRTSAQGDPTILKREADTSLLIPDGETAVIGGIYTRTAGRNVDQVPFFGDIPVLGVLFQRRRASDNRNELMIFITPHIVNRSKALMD